MPSLPRSRGRRLRPFITALVAITPLVIAPCTVRGQGAPAGRHPLYDIPALPLDAALNRFSEISRVDVLLHDLTSPTLRSRPVKGRQSAATALSIMLEGSGYVARFTSAASAVIIPKARETEFDHAATTAPQPGGALLSLDMLRVTAPRLIGLRRNTGADRLFVQKLASAIRQHITDRALLKGGTPSKFELSARVTPAGALHDVRILSSHNAALEGQLIRTLNGAHFDLIVPDGLPQPVLFEITGR